MHKPQDLTHHFRCALIRHRGEGELERCWGYALQDTLCPQFFSSSAAEESPLASQLPMGCILSSLLWCCLADQPSSDVPASCGGEHGGASVREAYSSVAGMSELGISGALEKSKEQGWTEVREGASSSGGPDDSVVWEELKATYPIFFRDDLDVKLGRLIAEGGQAHIYEATVDDDPELVAKVFKMEGFCLADLKRQWPVATKTPKESPFRDEFVLGGVVFGERMVYCSTSYWGTFLEDGRFAFVMRRYWGDLRTYIDLKCEDNFQGPPFSHYQARSIMINIARGMKDLHERGVLHRDLKAANILVCPPSDVYGELRYVNFYSYEVGDYESSMMVQGTGFWRAPEVLEDLMKEPSDRDPKIWTEKVDIYSYGMTCYEVLTGHLPFHGYFKSDWDKVIKGERPPWPDYVDSRPREIVERCWHKEPSKRPTFDLLVAMLMKLYW